MVCISNLCITKMQLTNLCSFACFVFCYVTGQDNTPPDFFRFPNHFPRRGRTPNTTTTCTTHTFNDWIWEQANWKVGDGLLAAEPKCELHLGQNTIPSGYLNLTLDFKSSVTAVTLGIHTVLQKQHLLTYVN